MTNQRYGCWYCAFGISARTHQCDGECPNQYTTDVDAYVATHLGLGLAATPAEARAAYDREVRRGKANAS
jgi:hypothetical protein